MNLQEKLTLIEEVLDVAEGSLTPETLLAEVDEAERRSKRWKV